MTYQSVKHNLIRFHELIIWAMICSLFFIIDKSGALFIISFLFGSVLILILSAVHMIDSQRDTEKIFLNRNFKLSPSKTIVENNSKGCFYKKVLFEYKGKKESLKIPYDMDENNVKVNVYRHDLYFSSRMQPLIQRAFEGYQKRKKTVRGYLEKDNFIQFELLSV